MAKDYLIGGVAREVGITPHTIRYYEKRGLLPKPPRAAGYRRFGEEDIRDLHLIATAKTLGFTLREIREMKREKDQYPDRSLPQILNPKLKGKLDETKQQLATLKDRRDRLTEASRGCEETCPCRTL